MCYIRIEYWRAKIKWQAHEAINQTTMTSVISDLTNGKYNTLAEVYKAEGIEAAHFWARAWSDGAEAERAEKARKRPRARPPASVELSPGWEKVTKESGIHEYVSPTGKTYRSLKAAIEAAKKEESA